MKLGYGLHIYVGYHLATHVSLIQNDSYQQPHEKTKNNRENVFPNSLINS